MRRFALSIGRSAEPDLHRLLEVFGHQWRRTRTAPTHVPGVAASNVTGRLRLTGNLTSRPHDHDRGVQASTVRKPQPRRANAEKQRSLGDFPPLAARWSPMQRNKLRNPDHTPLSSTYKVKWVCEHCGQNYSQRVRDYVASEGACPSCNEKPVLTRQQRRLLFPGGTGAQQGIVGAVELNAPTGLSAPAVTTSKPKEAVSRVAGEQKTRLLNPELALKWESAGHLIDDHEVLYASPKLDGIRCVALLSATTDRPAFVSRQGTPLECCDHLAPEFAKLFRLDPNAVVDGELYTHDLHRDFEELTSAVRVSRIKRSGEQKELQRTLQYNAFDLMYASDFPEGRVSTFEERQEELKRLFHTARISGQVSIVPQKKVTKAEVRDEFRRAVQDGYEGLMVRRADSPYAFGKRTTNLLKVKEFQDAEYKIVGFEEGLGRLKHHLGSFVCEVPAAASGPPKVIGSEESSPQGPLRFRATPKCDDGKKRLLWQNRRMYKGKMLTVTYQNLTKQGIPRFPIAKAVRGLASGEDWL